jgi:alanine-glyoxylate transaminase/serine-glyoxylate transaminase/serine-pyruvate transaminase
MGQPAYKLMIPGPIQPDDDGLESLAQPVQPHYGPQWTRYYNETLDLLRQVYGTQGDVFLMVGSGTSAIDACMASSHYTGETIIIGSNGFFGDRLISIAEHIGLKVVPVCAPWGQPLQAEDFERALREHPDAAGLAVVHLETSTTIVNPVEAIGAVARRHDVTYIVDAVSSLGGLPMQMDAWGIDLCASASQKCLGTVPGLAPLAVGPRGWEAIKKRPNRGHSWYLDLDVWQWYAREWGDWHPSPVTMATSNVVSLRTSLEKLIAEGIETRMTRYRQLAQHLRDGLRRIGYQPFTPDELMAPVLTAAWGPEGVPTGKIVSYLADVHHIKISAGLGELKEKLIRIGHMAPTVSEQDLDDVIAALADFKP